MDRRNFLSGVGLSCLSLGLGLSSCSSAKSVGVSPTGQSLGHKRLPLAKVSPDRIVKETVGLRPFRLSGPRLDVQKMGSKTIFHHYGHGGSGFSLSWGTADIVAGKVASSYPRGTEIAVIGCGIMGLTTARTLQERGYKAVIYTRDLFPNHTSSKATGTWSPAHLLIEEERITPQFQALWEQACTYSFRSYQNLLGLGEMVKWIDHYSIGGRVHREEPRLHIKGQVPDQVKLRANQHPFKANDVTIQPAMVFNIPSYLQKLLDDFILFGGSIVVHDFKDLDEIAGLPQPSMVNCTGVWAKHLCDDEEVVPVSGQLAFLIPQPEINYRLSTPEGYIIPRNDGLVLGGTTKRGSWDTVPVWEDSLRMAKAVNEVVQNMRI